MEQLQLDFEKSRMRLSVAYQEVSDLMKVVKLVSSKLGPTIPASLRELDLSNNKLKQFQRELEGLAEFKNLETLVLDGNMITEYTKFPLMSSLRTLWLNRNNIGNLVPIVNTLMKSTPNLTSLSMLSYFNGGSLAQYNDYRLYILSKLQTLHILDDTPVSKEELQNATKAYGDFKISIAKEESEKQRLEELRQKRREKKLKRKQEILEFKKNKLNNQKKQSPKKKSIKKSSSTDSIQKEESSKSSLTKKSLSTSSIVEITEQIVSDNTTTLDISILPDIKEDEDTRSFSLESAELTLPDISDIHISEPALPPLPGQQLEHLSSDEESDDSDDESDTELQQ